MRSMWQRVTRGGAAASNVVFCARRSALFIPLYTVDRCSRSFLLRSFVPSLSVEPTREQVDHCKKVLCEFLAAPPLACVCLIEKDESGAGPFDDPLNQLDAEAREAVTVGHHNFVDQSFLDVFQKPREAFPFVVETGSDVLVNFVVGESGLYRLDLSAEVVFLLG
jgi:hypothetical protein